MIADVRIYDCKPGMMAEWVALYEKEAWPLQKKYLGNCLGWYTSIEGRQHRIVHIWGYDSQADRETKRAALVKDPAWQAFMKQANAMGAFAAQENSIMTPGGILRGQMMESVAVIIAAGLGTRMKSALPKAAHKLAGRPMLKHLLAASEAVFGRSVVVVGPDMPALVEMAAPHEVVVQAERLGTAHAARQAEGAFGEGWVAVFYADNPLVSEATMLALLTRAEAGDAGLVLLGMTPPNPGKYGRLVTEGAYVSWIVEFADASAEERRIPLCNAGGLVAKAGDMRRWLGAVRAENTKGEYYLTDIVAIARGEGVRVAAVEAPFEECMGVNSRAELAAAEAVLQARLRDAAMEAGVSMLAPETVFFSADTALAADVAIGPYVVFGPGVRVEAGAEIKAFSHLEGCAVQAGAVIGPYARLRPGADVGPGAHVGNFVEIKAASLGAGAKANHLSYIGDAEIGAGTNIGAGTITCNYDGKNKHKTKIGARAFIGSNTALVAPVSVGDDALVAAGSVITEDVGDGALAIGRARQVAKAKRGH